MCCKYGAAAGSSPRRAPEASPPCTMARSVTKMPRRPNHADRPRPSDRRDVSQSASNQGAAPRTGEPLRRRRWSSAWSPDRRRRGACRESPRRTALSTGFDTSKPTVAFPNQGTYGFESPDAPALAGGSQHLRRRERSALHFPTLLKRMGDRVMRSFAGRTFGGRQPQKPGAASRPTGRRPASRGASPRWSSPSTRCSSCSALALVIVRAIAARS